MIKKIIVVATAISLSAPVAMPSTAKADPPPWAPAHGYRDKHASKHGHKRHYDRDYRTSRGDLFVPDGNFLRCNRDVIGAIVGGGAGTALGSTIGKGDGRDAAMIGGAILGLLGGYALGQNLDQADSACTGYALKQVPDGQSVRWRNPESGQPYQMVPQRSWETSEGRYCREYTATTVISGKQQESYGTACMQPDGSWQIVS
ncbi:RT0821/Lpp0805 family surface protein [Thalassospira lucentensis]|uniref:Surface antigen domain-containing protein n=1 Tax=Thalassospira lucentensis TaxID=168935 RepID=A0A358HND2_9PROT|nr:RT0821/Lpp0805 family surface protein [Thalassospira lucentensis]HBU96512.1 hypothetical protein [Thalassospira lucentensis]HCW69807.1 hypothetical protein [Thalassospira lucentensis]